MFSWLIRVSFCFSFNFGRADSCTVRTTGHQDTTMDVTGPCGSSLCLAAPTHLRWFRRLRRLRRNTPTHSSGLLALTTSVKCSASVSSPTSPQDSTLLKFHLLRLSWGEFPPFAFFKAPSLGWFQPNFPPLIFFFSLFFSFLFFHFTFWFVCWIPLCLFPRLSNSNWNKWCFDLFFNYPINQSVLFASFLMEIQSISLWKCSIGVCVCVMDIDSW